MEIHKPKAAHSVREFLVEIGTIICGILIALGLEQAVEWAHWRHEVAETREALKAEIAVNLGGEANIQQQEPCIDHRLAELTAWYRTGRGGQLRSEDALANRPILWQPLRSVWEVAKSGQVASHLPLEERLQFAKLYDRFANYTDYILKERDAWNELLRIDASKELDQVDRRDLGRAISLVRSLEASRRMNYDRIAESSAPFDVKPAPHRAPPGWSVGVLCRPLWR